jgi:PAS domain S-box-containing protein
MRRTARVRRSDPGDPQSTPAAEGARVPVAVRTWNELGIPLAPVPAPLPNLPPDSVPTMPPGDARRNGDGSRSASASIRRLSALSAVAARANADAPLAETLEAGLDEICRCGGWAAARALRVDPAGVLGWTVADPALRESVAGPETGTAPAVSATAVRAAAERQPVWSRIGRHGADPALTAARTAKMKAVLAVPVPVDGRVDTVLEFFSKDAEAPADADVELASEAARQLGLRMARERGHPPLPLPARDAAAGELVAALPLPIVAIAADATVTDWSPAAAAAFGWPAEAVVGAVPAVDAPWAPLVDALSQVLRTGERLSADVGCQTRDGRPLVVHVDGGPLSDGRGRVRGAVAVLMDVTERRELERTHDRLLMVEQVARVRAENAQRRAALLAYASELLDASFEYLQPGSAPMLGNLADLLVPTVADFCRIDVLREDRSLERMAIARTGPAAAHDEPPWADEPLGDAHPIRRVAATGQPLLMGTPSVAEMDALFGEPHERRRLPPDLRSVVIAPLVARGRNMGVLTLAMTDSGRTFYRDDRLLAQDLALRVALSLDNAKLYRDATAAGRWRDEVLAIVSHDLRTPLSVVDMSSQALLHAVTDDPEHAAERRQFGIIRNAAKQMRRMVEDLLDMAQADAGRLRVSPAAVPAASLVLDALEMHSAIAEQRDVELKVQLPRETTTALADRDRILQVLANLIGNAVRFTPAGGSVTLTAATRPDEVEFAVADTGVGIGREVLPHVFDRFWRAQRSSSNGAGLGLAIARGIVDAHGGRIWAESEVGAGSTFYFTLPRGRDSRMATGSRG